MLKTHTREVLYEKFRTDKLLARRATQKIGEEQTKKLLEGVFSSPLNYLVINPLYRSSRVVNISTWPVQNIVPVRIWIPFPLLLPPAVYTYQHSLPLHYSMPSPLCFEFTLSLPLAYLPCSPYS